MNRSKSGVALLLVIQMAGITGCAPSHQEELESWMSSERSKAEPRAYKVQEPKQFIVAEYMPDGKSDPFSQARLTLALQKEKGENAGSLIYDRESRRPKEPLENYPLDTMAMVGSLLKHGKTVGLIRVDGLLYQVMVGNHVGQNYGRITGISEGQITLREVVQDSAGEWTEKTTVMQLQEN